MDDVASSGVIELRRRRQMAGYVVLGLGAVLLASNAGLLGFLDWGRFWPLLLIGAGAHLLYREKR